MTVDYSNTVIYRLRSNDPLIKDKYIGKSKDFHKRKISHKSDCNNTDSPDKHYNYKVYVFIRENGGFENWHFEILETANLEDKKQAEALERYYIETLKPSLNINLPGQTPEERAEHNRVCCRIRHKKMKDDPEYKKKNAERSKKRGEDP